METILETLVMPYARELGLRRCDENRRPAGVTLTCNPEMGIGFFWTHCPATDSFAVSIMDIRLGELVSARYDHPEFYALNLMDEGPAFDAWREGMRTYTCGGAQGRTLSGREPDRRIGTRSDVETRTRPGTGAHPRAKAEIGARADERIGMTSNTGIISYHQTAGTFACPLVKGSRVRSRAIRFMPRYLAELSDRFHLDREVIEAACFGLSPANTSPAAELALRQLFSARPSPRCADMYYEGKVLEIVSLLLQEQLTRPHGADPSRTSQDDACIDRAIDYIHEHACEPMALETLERIAMMGRTKLSRLFKGKTGMSPIEYLGSVRMEAAIALLADIEKTVGNVAHAVGYENAGAFSERFKRTNGMTPKEFRKTIR